MVDKSWKRDERWVPTFMGGGRRHPSQGVAHPDVSGLTYTAEHKRRQWNGVSGVLKDAVNQAKLNAEMHPEKLPLTFFTFSRGRGKKLERWMMINIDIFNDLEDLAYALIDAYTQESEGIGN